MSRDPFPTDTTRNSIERGADELKRASSLNRPGKTPEVWLCACTCGCSNTVHEKTLCYPCWAGIRDHGALVHVDMMEHLRAVKSDA